MRPRFPLTFALALCVAAMPLLASDHAMPPPKDASTYAAFDAHAAEHVVIAAEPYETKEKGKIFRVNYVENGFMPIYIVVTNNSDKPVSLDQARIDFISAAGDRIPAAQAEDIERRMTHVKQRRQSYSVAGPAASRKNQTEDAGQKDRAGFC